VKLFRGSKLAMTYVLYVQVPLLQSDPDSAQNLSWVVVLTKSFGVNELPIDLEPLSQSSPILN